MRGTMELDDEEVMQTLQESGLRTWIGVIAGFRFAQQPRFKGTLKGRIYWWYEILTDLSVAINGISQFAALLTPEFRMIDRCLMCFPAASCLLCLFMSNYPRFKRKNFRSLVEEYENSFSDSQYRHHLEEQIRKGAKHTRSVIMCLVLLEFISMFIFCLILPVLNEATGFAFGPRRLAVPSLWLWDPLAGFWNYMAVVFVQLCGSVFVSLKKIGFLESFFVYASRQICMFTHLRYNLGKITDPLIVNDDGKVDVKEFTGSNRYLMKRKLIGWVKNHQNCLRLFEDLVKLYEWPLLVYFGATILILCTATYVTSDNSIDAQTCVICGVFNLGIFFELLFICRTGDRIKHESEKLLGALNGKNTFLLKSDEYKYLKMILTRCQSESVINASGGFPLTITTFIAIIKSSYSYYTLLKKVNGQTD
uniref:Odorant receptor n=1 Tax=Apolygus lucorum TaxID=248454 RepID=A0A1Q1NIN4_APOLU|nr:olfactory receptor [Apolygus lucorum]